MHGLISQLAGQHEVAVLSYREAGVAVEAAVQATGRCAGLVVTVENERLGVSQERKRRDQLRSLASLHSYERWVHKLPQFQRALERVCERWRPDAVVVEFAQMGYFNVPVGIPVILDAHNAEHEIIERMARVDRSLSRRVYSRINAAKLRREEAAIAAGVDAVAVTSERDRVLFEQLVPGLRPVVVPNGVDASEFQSDTPASEASGILFFGALDYFPNADAVRFFRREVWPRLRGAHPDLQWRIVGRLPPADIEAFGREPGIEVAGFVDDLREWIDRSVVVVVPLRAGSGTRLKVLEAMAMGRPVVSTSLGVEGLDVVEGRELLIADDPVEFAQAVGRLLDSGELSDLLGANARALVEATYDWRQCADRFDELIRSVAHGRDVTTR